LLLDCPVKPGNDKTEVGFERRPIDRFGGGGHLTAMFPAAFTAVGACPGWG
jgi:hypothetical protein